MPRKQKPTQKRLQIAAVVLIITLALVAVYALNAKPVESTNALNGEAGIYRDNQFYPFTTWIVNSQTVQDGDILYWKFWLSLTASNVVGQLTSVHFKVWQKINGVTSSTWQAGTEGSYGQPVTSPAESWFQVTLPVGVSVTVPIKYRDNLYSQVETSSNLLPFSTWDAATGNVLRTARLDKLYAAGWDIGTTTWEVHCTVVSLTWQYNDGTGLKTATIIPNPYDIYYTFSITRTEAGTLSVTLVGQGSH